MKKFLRMGKKALAVFMAVMMVMTAWVFFEPTKASAINAGSYKVKIYVNVTDSWDNNTDEYKYHLTYRNNNGLSTATTGVQEETLSDDSNGIDFNSEGEKTVWEGTLPGFPVSIYEEGRMYTVAWISRNVKYYIYVQVYNYNTDSYETVISSSERDFSGPGGIAGNRWVTSSTATVNSSKLPKATSVVWDTSPSDFTITGNTTAASHCVDQYGVVIGTTPTATYTANPSTTLTQDNTNSTTKYSTKITAGTDARMSGQDVNSSKVTVKHEYTFNGATVSGTKQFTITDPQYNVTLNANGGTLSTASPKAVYYGDQYGVTPDAIRPGYSLIGFYPTKQGPFLNTNTPTGSELTSIYVVTAESTWYAAWRANQYTATFKYKDENYADATEPKTQYYETRLTAPDVLQTINVGKDYTYTFKEWSPTVPSTMPAANNTYTATYDMTTHYADYTEVVKQIGAAESKMAEAYYQESAYTPASVSAFKTAYNQAVASNNNKLLKSQQSQVDALAEALKTARENLTLKKYTVLFVDEDGAIIKDGYFYVDYGTKVTAPTAPSKDPDATYHYTFTGWDSADSDPLSALDKVTDDLKFIAKFTKTAHSFTETTTPAGCQNDGVITHTCSDCGYSYTTAGDPAKHTWGNYVTIAPATCSAVGKEAKQCTVCKVFDSTTVRDIAKTSHSFSAWTNYQAATCGAQGVQTRTCANCGQLEVQKTAATGSHTYETKHTCAATCTADGYTVKVCTVCGNTTITTTTKLGHNLTTTTTQAATCASVGVKETKCSRCDYGKTEIIPATGTHSYGAWTTISTANCISKGVKTRECSVCGKVETDITNQTAHSWGAWTEVTPATCTGKGVQKRTCPTCGQSETKETTALGHNFVQSAVVPATCEAGGYTLNVCDRSGCGAQQIIDKTTALGHNWTTVAHDADCTHSAYTEYKCANDASHNYNKYDETKPALGHDFTGTATVTKAATCTEDGTKTIACTRCSEVQTVTIPKTGHNYTAGAAKAPSCTTSGYTPYTCSACGDTYNVYDSSKPATGHSWGEWNVTTAPTETTDGEQTRTCSVCGATETAPVPATSHTLVEDTSKYVAPTCTTDGEKVYKCTATHPGQSGACTYTVTEVVPKLGHDLSTTKTDATCTVDGKVITGCSRCDYKAETVIPATGHSYTNTVTTQPTCTESGFTILACKGCGKTIRTDFVPAYGHKYDEGVYEDATCTTPGGIRYTCTNTNPDGTPCGHSYLVKDTEPLGHTWGKWHYVEHPTVEDAYAKQRDCTRGTCTAIEYERGKMSNEDDINVYYKVEFYNPWTTDTCYELNNGRTKLAKTYKTTKVNEGYYLAGTEATYPSSVLPRRDKDYTWGAYKLIDWTYDEVGQTDSALNDMKSITKNMAVYANFEGYDVYYKVRFWSGSDPLTIEQIILHGHSAQYPFDNPTKADNLHYKYEFTGWDYDYTAIYDSVGINALYNEIPKTYTMVYCDWNGDELAKEDFQYGDPAKKNPTNLERPENATYIYQFSGKWQTQPGKEEYINLNSLIVPLGTKEGDEVKVYAKYYQKAKSYVVNIYGYGINKELIPGATVQIYNSNGQIVTTTKLDEESKAIITLNYDTTYQIVITDDVGNVGKGDIELNTTMKDEQTGLLVPTMTTIYLKQYEDPDHGGSNCHCICHSFLGGFWISILNLIYRLTDRKIVCCYDMFATHGDKLLYGK